MQKKKMQFLSIDDLFVVMREQGVSHREEKGHRTGILSWLCALAFN